MNKIKYRVWVKRGQADARYLLSETPYTALCQYAKDAHLYTHKQAYAIVRRHNDEITKCNPCSSEVWSYELVIS